MIVALLFNGMIDSMATAKPKNKDDRSYATFMHHFAWSIVCLMLFVSVLGIFTQAQKLETENASLEKQLAAIKKADEPATCKVIGGWKANTTKLMSVGGRQFLVHPPVDFFPDKYYPLLLFYPGKGATAQIGELGSGLNSLPAVVAYPYPTISKDGVWAWEGAPYSSDADDVAFTESILDTLQNDLCIDRTKIYASGFSNGGGFASLLSCELSDRFAAYAVVSGAFYMPEGQCIPPKPTPILSIHGDSDGNVPYQGSPIRKLPAIDDWTARRAALNKCGKPTVSHGTFNMLVTTWDKCKDNATVQNIRVQGGQHGWGKIDDTNAIIWQFLSRFSL